MILIALGSNLFGTYGSPEGVLVAVKQELAAREIVIEQSSGVWITSPVPVSDQPWYRNAVISVRVSMSPMALLKILQDIERKFGRIRGEKNAPRILDMDIIAYDDEVYEYENLVIPHPRMHERAFVLYPLQEIVPDWFHPVLKCSVQDLIKKLPLDQVVELMSLEGI
ncbi:MAG: 2-amino-4-hydroxy-6-hydroxymethyldihydropteridine diphosphokinase [Alphaproteobacteria bacterium]|nr:2-amino-4-hydroxy-6-hydroxymethyldihydropteridine diphosphokinase [Alphaproteobacteria bacterium]